MRLYAKVSNDTIQIIPIWKTPIKSDLYTKEIEIVTQMALLAYDNEIYIPLSSFKRNKVPVKSVILYNNKEYSSLTSLVDFIYRTRNYSITEEAAKTRIKNLIFKNLTTNKKLYGSQISQKFDNIDASNYNIEY